MSCGCVSYRCGDQQSAGLWLLRLVAAALGNHKTITNAERKKKRKNEAKISVLYLGLMLDADSKLTVYQDKRCVGEGGGGGDVMIVTIRILLTHSEKLDFLYAKHFCYQFSHHVRTVCTFV